MRKWSAVAPNRCAVGSLTTGVPENPRKKSGRRCRIRAEVFVAGVRGRPRGRPQGEGNHDHELTTITNVSIDGVMQGLGRTRTAGSLPHPGAPGVRIAALRPGPSKISGTVPVPAGTSLGVRMLVAQLSERATVRARQPPVGVTAPDRRHAGPRQGPGNAIRGHHETRGSPRGPKGRSTSAPYAAAMARSARCCAPGGSALA